MKHKEHELPRPTEGELELLQVLWEMESATVRDLFDAMNRKRPVGYTSVLKQLQIMTEKGLVRRDEAVRAHVYRTSLSQEQTQSQFLKDLSDRLFSGSAAQLALHALSMEPASVEDLKEIRKLIEQEKGKR
jgi:BlaI family transcriptional regulator, penicillinase repressor